MTVPVPVFERVVDEVPKRLLEAQPVRLRLGAGWNVDRDPSVLPRRALRESVCGRARQLIEGDGLDPEPERVLVGPGHEEQVVREEGEPIGLLRRGAHRCSELVCGPGAPERELELGLQESEGRT